MAPADKESGLPLEWSWVKEDIVDRVLDIVTTEDGDPKTIGDVTLASGVQWIQLGKTLVGIVLTTLVLGANAVQEAFFTGLSNYPSAIASFTTDFVTAVLNVPDTLLGTAADTSAGAAADFGVFAFPIAVGIVLVALYITARAVQVIYDG